MSGRAPFGILLPLQTSSCGVQKPGGPGKAQPVLAGACHLAVSAPSPCRMWTSWTARYIWYFYCDLCFLPYWKTICILMWNKARKNRQALNGLCYTVHVLCHKRSFCIIQTVFLKQLHKKSHNIWKVKFESKFLQHTTRGTEICKQQARMKLQWQQLPCPGGVWRQGCMTLVLF